MFAPAIHELAETLVDLLLDPEEGRDVAFLASTPPGFVQKHLIPELELRGGHVLRLDLGMGQGSGDPVKNFWSSFDKAVGGQPISDLASTGDEFVDFLCGLRIGVSKPLALVIEEAELFQADDVTRQGLAMLRRALDKVKKMPWATGKDLIVVFNASRRPIAAQRMAEMLDDGPFAGSGMFNLSAAAAKKATVPALH